MYTEAEFRSEFAQYIEDLQEDTNRPADCTVDPDAEWQNLLTGCIAEGRLPETARYWRRVLTCWNCSVEISCSDMECPECDEECRWPCEVCGNQHTPSEPGQAAWAETPDDVYGMIVVCDYCENTLPRHPEEGYVLTPTNIFA